MKTWTLRITGGQIFQMQLQDHPTLQHNGAETLWQATMDLQRVREIAESIHVNSGATVSVYATNVEDTPKVPKMNGWPTERCPICYFFEMDTSNHCGVADWPVPVLKSAMQRGGDKAIQDRQECPRNKR